MKNGNGSAHSISVISFAAMATYMLGYSQHPPTEGGGGVNCAAADAISLCPNYTNTSDDYFVPFLNSKTQNFESEGVLYAIRLAVMSTSPTLPMSTPCDKALVLHLLRSRHLDTHAIHEAIEHGVITEWDGKLGVTGFGLDAACTYACPA